MAMPSDISDAAAVSRAVARADDEYWADDNAAVPVLLVDQAADAITEALHRVRSGSALDDEDVAAAGVALGDLFGGLDELADLLSSSVCKYAEEAPLQVGQLENSLETLRATVRQAKRAAERMHFSSASIHC